MGGKIDGLDSVDRDQMVIVKTGGRKAESHEAGRRSAIRDIYERRGSRDGSRGSYPRSDSRIGRNQTH